MADFPSQLAQLLANYSKSIRDFTSWSDLLGGLRLELLTVDLPNAEFFGLPLNLVDYGLEARLPYLLKLVELEVFPVRAEFGSRETKADIITNMHKMCPDDPIDDEEDDNTCDLSERRAFLICHMKSDTYTKLVAHLDKQIEIIKSGDVKLYTTAVHIAHYYANDDISQDMLEYSEFPDCSLDKVLVKTTFEHKKEIEDDLVKLYLIDLQLGRPTFLFDEVIRVLQY